ncbi:MAG: TMEM165/GDT1 family protein [Methanomicrobia archaeon]|nr:TMEM165/GDT1 family protein [Methanomicrobia archaeon]HHF09592.1 TMEM165/GDT1 family protein [Methanomicrobia archaeon]
MLQDLLIPMIVIGIAELGDKTQIAIFMLSTKTKEHLKLLSGIILAFLLADGAAVLAGDYITRILPINYIKIISGLIFILFGVFALRSMREEKETHDLKNPFYSGFALIFISELGDKTQITSGLFAARYNPLFVLIGIMISLTLLSIMAIYLGKFISTRINERILSKIGGIVFILIGVVFLVT